MGVFRKWMAWFCHVLFAKSRVTATLRISTGTKPKSRPGPVGLPDQWLHEGLCKSLRWSSSVYEQNFHLWQERWWGKKSVLGLLVDKAVLVENDRKILQFNCIKAHVDAVFTSLENCVERFDAMNADKRYELNNLVLVLDRKGKYDISR